MIEFEKISVEIIVITVVIYMFLNFTIAKIGTYKTCGGLKSFFFGLFLSPIIGIAYVVVHPQKSVLKIVHYRCHHCGLEYTTSHKYCPTCYKEGHKHRLEKISMRTY